MISQEKIFKIAEGAKLNFTKLDAEKAIAKLLPVLSWLENIQDVNTDNVEPLVNILYDEEESNQKIILEENIENKTTDPKILLKMCKNNDEEYFLVPKFRNLVE